MRSIAMLFSDHIQLNDGSHKNNLRYFIQDTDDASSSQNEIHAVINKCMNSKDFTTSLKTYIATVRVTAYNDDTTANTSIQALNEAHAFMMLSHLYGRGNVIHVEESIEESAQTEGINGQDVFDDPSAQRVRTDVKHKPETFSCVCEACVRKRKISSQPIADQIKHKLVQNKLAQQMLRKSNIVKPTQDDVRIARGRTERALKCKDLEYADQMKRLSR